MPDSIVDIKLLIISRDTLLDAQKEATSKKLFRTLAQISRRGIHILLSAPEPERWVPTRGNVDSALNQQNELMKLTNEAGGGIEGVYYVPRSLLTQDRNREGALKDILKRYSVLAGHSVLFSSSTPFIKAAERMGISSQKIALTGKQGTKLIYALASLV